MSVILKQEGAIAHMTIDAKEAFRFQRRISAPIESHNYSYKKRL